MAVTGLGMMPACLHCMRQLTKPLMSSRTSTLPLMSVRGLKSLTKAEEEDLQGIPVRLLRDIKGFGRKGTQAIVRVKAGRMRNVWFPKGVAEYMTKKRFEELGLTTAAIGVRDRSFGDRASIAPTPQVERKARPVPVKAKVQVVKEDLTLPPQEQHNLLTSLLPPVLVFSRKPIPVPVPAPATPALPPKPIKRSPSLAPDASTLEDVLNDVPPPAPPPVAENAAIFGSVSTTDIVGRIKEILREHPDGNRVAIAPDGITIHGLGEGDDRIKRLGTFEVDIIACKDAAPLRRSVKVEATLD